MSAERTRRHLKVIGGTRVVVRRIARRFPRTRQLAIALLEAWVALRRRIPIERRIAHLAATRAARLKLGLSARWLSVRDALNFWPARPIRLDLRFSGRRVSWRVAHTVDLWVLRQILVDGEYSVSAESPRVVLDLGSHIGTSLLYFRAAYPDARIIGIEPDPEAFKLLEQNAAPLDVEIHRLAVAATDGPVSLFGTGEPWFSTLYGTGEPKSVDGRSLDSLFQQLGLPRVDLLKVDIEEAEYDAFRAFQRLRDVGAVVGELHSSDEGRRTAFFALFEGFKLRVRTDDGHTTFTATRQ
jgi:FkbM family methyltransferase